MGVLRRRCVMHTKPVPGCHCEPAALQGPQNHPANHEFNGLRVGILASRQLRSYAQPALRLESDVGLRLRYGYWVQSLLLN